MHTIRLRGPWDYQVLTPTTDARSGRLMAPPNWHELLGPDFAGQVRCTRYFNRPTNLAANEKVWLVVEGVESAEQFHFNGTPLAVQVEDGAARCDLTGRLEPRNRFELTVRLPSDALRRDVRLEIDG